MEDELYREIILEHNRNPKNWGIIDDSDLYQMGTNPVCGDALKVSLNVSNEKIIKVGFECEGCAISKAAASIFLEHIKDMFINEVTDVKENDVLKMLGLGINVSRKKCALLAHSTIKKMLETVVII